MSISSRIHDTIEGWSGEWGDRLHNWIMDWISAGIIKFIETIEPEGLEFVDEGLAQLSDAPGTPDVIKNLVGRIRAGGKPIPLLILIPVAVLMLFPMVLALFEPLGRIITYGQERLFRSGRLDPTTAIRATWRGLMTDTKMRDTLTDLGYDEEDITTIINATKVIPPLADMVRFADFGSFDPSIIALWRQFYDAPGWITEPFSLLGVTNQEGRDWANKYWFSHWRQPGRYELGEIYRRGLLGTPKIGQDEIGGDGSDGPAEDLVKNAYLTQGYSSFWQGHLLQLSREIPTRVDVRRWWDMRTIDESEMRSIYQRRGYFGKDQDNYVLWTKVYVAFPDLMARWTKGWITEADVRAELTSLGMPAERVEEMIQTKIKPNVPEPINEAKNVSQTAIIKWVKEDIEARWEEGVDLLMDLGYNEDGARFILDAYIAEMGSPETFEDWKQLTAEYRRAAGMTTPAFNDKLREAGDELVKIADQVKALSEAVRTEEQLLVDQDVIPEETEKRLKELQVAHNRAIAEKERLQAAYNTLVAEFRQTEV